jgi:uncharacterized protein (DUF1810 family)
LIDPFDLQRFVDAQAPVYERVRTELRAGRKRTHWIWFVFPQLKGLGSSAMANRFGIGSLEEAVAYLRHPVLGPRLMESIELINALDGRSIEEILGFPDDVKFRSSLTLFLQAEPQNEVLVRALDRYFAGEPDQNTIDLLSAN